MKKPKLDFKEVFVVEGWATEIKQGMGILFPSIREGICEYSDSWLVFFEGEGSPKKIYKCCVFEDEAKALSEVKREKKKYIEYLEKSVKENTLLLKELKS